MFNEKGIVTKRLVDAIISRRWPGHWHIPKLVKEGGRKLIRKQQ